MAPMTHEHPICCAELEMAGASTGVPPRFVPSETSMPGGNLKHRIVVTWPRLKQDDDALRPQLPLNLAG